MTAYVFNVGDVGQAVSFTAYRNGVVDSWSSATVTLYVQKPSGAQTYLTGNYSVTSQSGATFTYTPDDETRIDEPGVWQIQPHVVDGSADYLCDTATMSVGPRLYSGTPAPIALVSELLTGTINVRQAPYYATGDGSTDDAAAIQAAITYACTEGANVYFPAGNYRITTGLVVPNTNPGGGLWNPTLFGDGPELSTIYGDFGGADHTTPILTYESGAFTIHGGGFHRLQFLRTPSGPTVYHTSSGDTQRMVGFNIANCQFRTYGDIEPGTIAFELEGLLYGSIRDSQFDGSETAARFSGSHYSADNIHAVLTDGTSTNGIIWDCGNSHLSNVRLEAPDGGFGFRLLAHNVTVKNLSMEGHTTGVGIEIDAAVRCATFENTALGQPTQAGSIGILVNGGACNVKFHGGEALGAFYSIGANTHLTYVEAGCIGVDFTGWHASPGLGNSDDDVAEWIIEDGCIASVEFFTGGSYNSRTVYSRGHVSGTQTALTAGSIGSEDWRTGMVFGLSAPDNLDTITGTADGRQLVLYFSNGNTTLRHGVGNLSLRGAANVNPAAGNTITLTCIQSGISGGTWYETARNF